MRVCIARGMHEFDCAVQTVVDADPPSALNDNDKFADVFEKLSDRVDEESIKIAQTLWQDGKAAQSEGKKKDALQIFKQAIDARDGREATGLCQDKEAGRSRVSEMQAHVVAMKGEGVGLNREEQIQLAEDTRELGNILKDKGDYVRALLHYGKAQEVFRSVYGDRHLESAKTRENMAIVYEVQGKFKEALELYIFGAGD